ncbi:hypothetical protein ACC746_36695, partial [Rhizobium ruizarguesonis]
MARKTTTAETFSAMPLIGFLRTECLILALNTAQAEWGDAFDSGTQRVTACIVAKEKTDWRKNRKQPERITETPSAAGPTVLLRRH